MNINKSITQVCQKTTKMQIFNKAFIHITNPFSDIKQYLKREKIKQLYNNLENISLSYIEITRY